VVVCLGADLIDVRVIDERLLPELYDIGNVFRPKGANTRHQRRASKSTITTICLPVAHASNGRLTESAVPAGARSVDHLVPPGEQVVLPTGISRYRGHDDIPRWLHVTGKFDAAESPQGVERARNAHHDTGDDAVAALRVRFGDHRALGDLARRVNDVGDFVGAH